MTHLRLAFKVTTTLTLAAAMWAARGWLMEPALALIAGVALCATMAALWPSDRLRAHDAARRAEEQRSGGRSRPGSSLEDVGLAGFIFEHPSRVMVLSFLILCALGALALSLPVCAVGEPPAPLDAAFTAVSAACVTGLGVVDVPSVFNLGGQLTLLILIQVGGLGVMAFSVVAVELLKRRLSVSQERAAADLIGAESAADLRGALERVLWVTGVTEGAGALALTLGFWFEGDGLLEGLWRGLFTSVSAFCNAGFALQSSSLVPYAESPYLLLITSVIIAVGGIGPIVALALHDAFRRDLSASPARRLFARATWRRPLSLHVRLVLWTSAALTLLPALFIAAVEWNGALAHLTPLHRLTNALFQSVTLRTAGFNSIDLTALHPATWTLTLFVMFVGGSPGSTAGGVKTTTIAVVLLAVAAVARGRERVEVFGRTLTAGAVMRAGALCTLSVFGVGGALMALQLTQRIPLDVALFEVVSALATVGLSTGGTAALDAVGKVIIMACMFAGRVGPLTLFVLFTRQARVAETRRYPDEPLPIG